MPALVPTLVYLLCFLTSVICALLLGRSYNRMRAPTRSSTMGSAAGR